MTASVDGPSATVTVTGSDAASSSASAALAVARAVSIVDALAARAAAAVVAVPNSLHTTTRDVAGQGDTSSHCIRTATGAQAATSTSERDGDEERVHTVSGLLGNGGAGFNDAERRAVGQGTVQSMPSRAPAIAPVAEQTSLPVPVPVPISIHLPDDPVWREHMARGLLMRVRQDNKDQVIRLLSLAARHSAVAVRDQDLGTCATVVNLQSAGMGHFHCDASASASGLTLLQTMHRARTPDGLTALHIAAGNGDGTGVLEALLAHGWSARERVGMGMDAPLQPERTSIIDSASDSASASVGYGDMAGSRINAGSACDRAPMSYTPHRTAEMHGPATPTLHQLSLALPQSLSPSTAPCPWMDAHTVAPLAPSWLARLGSSVHADSCKLGWTALHCAAAAGNDSALALLLSKGGAQSDWSDAHGRTALDVHMSLPAWRRARDWRVRVLLEREGAWVRRRHLLVLHARLVEGWMKGWMEDWRAEGPTDAWAEEEPGRGRSARGPPLPSHEEGEEAA